MPLDRFPSREEAYEARRNKQPLATGMTPLELRSEARRVRERTCDDCAKLPVPSVLAGADVGRTSTYDWSWK